jgi:DNA mismatch endonuclease, patch repair protein
MKEGSYPHPTSPAVSARMKANRKVDSRPEKSLRARLHRDGYRFRKNYRVDLQGFECTPDIVFTAKKLAIFVDGCFWHACPEHGTQPVANSQYWLPKLERNKERDREVEAALAQAGWRVLRIWEHVPVDEAAARVAEALKGLPASTKSLLRQPPQAAPP